MVPIEQPLWYPLCANSYSFLALTQILSWFSFDLVDLDNVLSLVAPPLISLAILNKWQSTVPLECIFLRQRIQGCVSHNIAVACGAFLLPLGWTTSLHDWELVECGCLVAHL